MYKLHYDNFLINEHDDDQRSPKRIFSPYSLYQKSKLYDLHDVFTKDRDHCPPRGIDS